MHSFIGSTSLLLLTFENQMDSMSRYTMAPPGLTVQNTILMNPSHKAVDTTY